MSLASVMYIETLQKNCWTLFFKWEESAYITNNISVLQSTPEAGHVIHIAVCPKIAITEGYAFK